MEYNKISPKAIKGWRISNGIRFGASLLVIIPILLALASSQWNSFLKPLIMVALVLLCLYYFLSLLIYPSLEYKQWGYIIEDDKVIIRHGIFFITKSVIPIIRIQNITLSQGPINQKLGLYNVELALASGSFDIVGLDKETAESISENLKNRLYSRVSEKGVI